jgi:hypothetical protein
VTRISRSIATASMVALITAGAAACSSSGSANESCATYLNSSDSDKESAARALANAHNDRTPTIVVRGSIRAFCSFGGGNIEGIYHG